MEKTLILTISQNIKTYKVIELINFEKSHFALFTNGKNTGYITYTFGSSNITVLGGINTEAKQIQEITIENSVRGKINPTKVFLFIAKVLKKTLCPHCL